ncbi:MAG: GGDEF domain-containing protein [Burkholderiales bacterium]
MNLDIRTLDVAIIIICSVFGPVAFAFGSGQAYALSARLWGAAVLALAGGLALVNSLGHLPEYFPQFFGPALFALGLTFAQLCARSARGLGMREPLGWGLLASFALAMFAAYYTSQSATLRHFLEMEFIGLMACKTAYEFDRCRELRDGRPMLTIATIFCLLGAVLLVRGLLGVPGLETGAAMEQDTIGALSRVGMIAGLLICTIVLLWVITETIARQVRELVSLDPLSGTLNRQTMIAQVVREISRTRRRANSRFSMLLFNVDNFRRINDAYGQDTGDKVLKSMANALRKTIRDYDLLGRIEGDSFMLVLPGTWGENAVNLAARAQKEIATQAKLTTTKNSISVSVGIAVLGDNGEDWNALLLAAETAMRTAKGKGGNRIEVAESELLPSNGDADSPKPAII